MEAFSAVIMISYLLEKSLSMRIKADLTLLTVSAIWGFAFLTQSIAAQFKSAYLFNGLGFLLAATLLFPFIKNKRGIPRAQWFWMAVAGFILFIASAFQQVGIFYTAIANAGFLTSLYTVITPFILFFLFREKPKWIDILAVLLAGFGAFFLSTAGNFHIQPGDLLEITGAIFWALHIVVLGKFALKFDAISFSAGQFFFSAIFNLVVAFFVDDFRVLFAPLFIGAVLFRSVFSITIGYTLQVWGQRHTPPTDAALILSLESVFAAFAGWIFLKEFLLPVQLIGCALIFVAVLLTQIHPLLNTKNIVQTS